MIDLLALLKEARDGFKAVSRNTYSSIASNLKDRLDAAIAELEAAPERKCWACTFWMEHMEDTGDCTSHEALLSGNVNRTDRGFGCIFWQSREVKR